MAVHIKSEHAKRLVEQGYDQIAPAYLDFITTLPSPNTAWTDKLLARLAHPSTVDVLELGCGNGMPCTAHLASRVRQITATDISSAQMALAKQNLAAHENVTYLQRDMLELEFEERSFGAIMALYSLQHLTPSEQPLILSKIYSWLASGGVLLVNFDPEERPGTVMDDWLGVRMYHSSHGAQKSLEMTRAAGFEIIDSEVVSVVDGKKTVPFLWVLARSPSLPPD
ncbi:hypothetical protein AC578_10487 [Pseudocercospora eumusae]|uniref:Methyltransferase domain-containing protein n=1 Tax=Pseudocercospora eumusae TaxID=321146 RepID=A0A139H8H4_9PEZI|nr:hypothetical protein AC578_10487 [Pseudocercospora eumusae]